MLRCQGTEGQDSDQRGKIILTQSTRGKGPLPPQHPGGMRDELKVEGDDDEG